MKKKVLFSLILIAVLTAGVMPQAVYGADDEKEGKLTDDEETFVAGIQSSISEFEFNLGELRWIVNKGFSGQQEMTARRGHAADMLSGGCRIQSSPSTMEGIRDAWNGEFCNDYSTMRGKVLSLLDDTIKNPESTMSAVQKKMINADISRLSDKLFKIGAMLNERVNELKEQRQREAKAEAEAKDWLDLDDDDCFIATAAYGSPAAEEINILRQFRDEFLLHNPPGKAFVAVYYATSPPIAEFISRHEVLRTAVREGFVDHVVAAVELAESWWTE